MLKLDLGKSKQLQDVTMDNREFENISDREINKNFNRYVSKEFKNKNDFTNLYQKICPRPQRTPDYTK
jgi:hypothetical protein